MDYPIASQAPEWVKDWHTRSPMLVEQLLEHAPSVMCLQEVDHFQEWKTKLAAHGYTGIHQPKPKLTSHCTRNGASVDGCALFYHESMELLDCTVGQYSDSSQVYIIARFKSVTVVTTHLKAKPAFEDLRVQQISELLEILANETGPLILAGDLNTTYLGEVYPMILADGFQDSYSTVLARELEFSTWKVRDSEVKRTIDYVFCKELTPLTVLDSPTSSSVSTCRFPSIQNPSDHIPLLTKFQ